MLPQANRLRHWKDFQTVYQRGSSHRSRKIGLRAYRRPIAQSAKSDLASPPGESSTHFPPTRIGIAVGRKISKKAVVRNQIKRRIRAALRQLLPQIAPGWDIVIFARSPAQECNSTQFLQELEQLLAKAEVLNGHSRGSLL